MSHYLQVILEMDSDDDETKRDYSADDPRALVAALTQLLTVGDDIGAPAQAVPSSTEGSISRNENTGNFSPNEQKSSSPTSGDNARETSLIPEFLSDASVRAALHRANALRPQGHLSDEPQFPSALGRSTHVFQMHGLGESRKDKSSMGMRDLSTPNSPSHNPRLTLLRCCTLGPQFGKVPVFLRGSCQVRRRSPC
jgi:hypothetical protein